MSNTRMIIHLIGIVVFLFVGIMFTFSEMIEFDLISFFVVKVLGITFLWIAYITMKSLDKKRN